MSEEDKKKDEEILKLKRQAMAAERLRFDAIRNVRLKRDPLRLDLLALGVAHEFNNILGAAEGYAEWALESGEANDMKEALEVIMKACQRSSQVTKALQGLIQPKEEEKKIFNLKDTLNDVKIIFNPLLKKAGVAIKDELPECSIYGNPAQIGELFINLIKNSLDAFSGMQTENKHIRFREYQNKDFISIEVSDNGPGIPDVYHEMLFQPFFSTKGVISAAVTGKVGGMTENEVPMSHLRVNNSGLGLYLSKSIVQEHGGNISLTKSEKGATFLIELPQLNQND